MASRLAQVAELAVQYFITDNRPNIAGLVLAGSADFKNELQLSDMFDPRLQRVVIKTVDVSYGGENGFNQAIELAAETLGSVKLVQEKKLLQRYFDEISQVRVASHGYKDHRYIFHRMKMGESVAELLFIIIIV